jgi:hypothetical protein
MSTLRPLTPQLSDAGWQPIETAPRDGTYVLGYGPHETRGFYIDAIHHYQELGWTVKWMSGYGEPTHWMPLPEPPQ